MSPLLNGLLVFSLLFFLLPSLNAANYFWKGKDNTDWNTLNNWELGSGATPGVLPGAGDNVTIDGTGGVNAIPVLANAVTISSLTITEAVSSSGGINLGGFTLNAGSLTLGTSGSPIPNVVVSNGMFDINGSVEIAGATFTDITNIDGGNFPTLRNATFTTDVVFTKTGGSNMGTPGDGNTYQGNFTFINSASGNVRFGVSAVNTYEGNVVLTNSSISNILTFGQNFTASVAGNLMVTNTSTSGSAIEIGRSGGGATVGGAFGLLSSAGTVRMTGVTETGTGFITVTAGSSFEADNCVFNGPASVTVTSNITSLDGSSFNGSTNSFTSAGQIGSVSNSVFGPSGGSGISTTFTSGVSSNNPWVGGNTFNSDVSFIRTGSTANNWRLDNTTANTFGAAMNPIDVVINNGTGTGEFTFAAKGATFYGNLTVIGTAKSAGGAVTMAGVSGPQTITGIDGWTYPTLNVTNTAGVSIDFSPTISTALSLSGILTVPTLKIVTLNSSATFSGSASGYVSGGAVRKLGRTAFNSTPSFIFHVGADGYYAPFYYTTSNAGANPQVTVQYTRPGPGPGMVPLPLELVSQTEQWLLTVVNTTIANTIVTLPYGTQSGVIGDEADLRVAFSADGGGSWTNLGGTAGGGTIVGNSQSFAAGSSYIVTLASVNAAQTPLPVELVYFRAKADEDQVKLSWATASELNNDYFEVERSANGLNFEAISSRIEGAGTTNEPLTYEYIDLAPPSGVSYYRLKQVDFGGYAVYSDIVAIRLGELATSELLIFPNPVQGQLQVRWNGANNIDKLRLIDAKGQVLSLNAIINNKQAEVQLEGLPAGVYFLELLSGKERKIEKLIIKP